MGLLTDVIVTFFKLGVEVVEVPVEDGVIDMYFERVYADDGV